MLNMSWGIAYKPLLRNLVKLLTVIVVVAVIIFAIA